MVVVVVVVVEVVVVVDEVVVVVVATVVEDTGVVEDSSAEHAAMVSDAARLAMTTRRGRTVIMTETTLGAGRFDVIAFDADDTLWHSEDGFHAAEKTFVELVRPFVAEGVDPMAALTATERANLPTYGYGVKAFGLSMIEAAISVTGGAVSTDVLEKLIVTIRDLLLAPVRLLPGVAEVIVDVARDHRVAIITKGDLVHQSRKVATSGLEHLFDHVEIVLEKDVDTYRRVLREFNVEPHRFCMVGNSVKSDILPVLELGGHAIHVPYHVLWELEKAPHPTDHEGFTEVSDISEVPVAVRGQVQ